MYGVPDATWEKLKSLFVFYEEIDLVILYGSRAKGTYRKGSDIDLALKGKNVDFGLIAKLMEAIDDLLLPYTFDILSYNQITNMDLKDHIDRVGKIVYFKD